MNRRPTPKSFATPQHPLQTHQDDEKERARARPSENKLRSNLDECSPDELEFLRRKQQLINSRFSNDEALDAEYHLRNRPFVPVVLKPEHLTRALHPERLFTQFTEQSITPLLQRQRWLLHNIESQREQRELCEWVRYNDVNAFFRPVHYALHTRQLPRLAPTTTTNVRPSARTSMQYTLVESSLATADGVQALTVIMALETQLNAILSRILLRDSRALFVLEWRDTPEIVLVVGFTISYRATQHEEGAKTTLVALAENLIELARDEFDNEAVDEAPVQQIGLDVHYDRGWLRQALRKASLRYMYAAFAAISD